MDNAKNRNPHAVALGRIGGASKSAKKRFAAKANGILGGRPKTRKANGRKAP